MNKDLDEIGQQLTQYLLSANWKKNRSEKRNPLMLVLLAQQSLRDVIDIIRETKRQQKLSK